MSRRIVAILDWWPVGIAIAGSIAIVYPSVPTEGKVAAFLGQIVGLIVAFTKFNAQWTKHKVAVESKLEALCLESGGNSPLEVRLLRRLLQSAVFVDNGIDEGLWLVLGRTMMKEAADDASGALEKALEALRSRTITASSTMYDYMRAVLYYVPEYRGVCELSELTEKKANEFIFSLPQVYARSGKTIWRLFVLPDAECLKRLSAEKRRLLLEQLDAGVRLKWCRQQVANTGIYGDVAAGFLSDGRNVISFDPNRVVGTLEQFNLAFEHGSSDVTPEMLRN